MTPATGADELHHCGFSAPWRTSVSSFNYLSALSSFAPRMCVRADDLKRAKANERFSRVSQQQLHCMRQKSSAAWLLICAKTAK